MIETFTVQFQAMQLDHIKQLGNSGQSLELLVGEMEHLDSKRNNHMAPDRIKLVQHIVAENR